MVRIFLLLIIMNLLVFANTITVEIGESIEDAINKGNLLHYYMAQLESVNDLSTVIDGLKKDIAWQIGPNNTPRPPA